MKYKIATIILTILFLFCGLLYVNQLKENRDIELGKQFITNWACMDGCYNMLEVIYIEVDYSNKTLEGYHSKCSEECYNKWFVNGGLDE